MHRIIFGFRKLVQKQDIATLLQRGAEYWYGRSPNGRETWGMLELRGTFYCCVESKLRGTISDLKREKWEELELQANELLPRIQLVQPLMFASG